MNELESVSRPLTRLEETELERRRADARLDVARRAKLSDEELLPLARARLEAWREWGIELGPAERGGDTSGASNRLLDADYTARNRARGVAAVPADKFEAYKANDDPDKLTIAGVLRAAHVSYNSGENEWYTPQPFIDAATRVMGAIDLDPASTPAANEIVRAAQFYTVADDGLRQQWHGRVWMNPPYSQPLIAQFCEKLAASYPAAVTQACALVNNGTETNWFQELARVAAALCFPQGRIAFWHPTRTSASPLQGQTVVYLGPNAERFCAEFSTLGLVTLTWGVM